MDMDERRSTPRLPCRLPLRFRVLQGPGNSNGAGLHKKIGAPVTPSSATFEGEAINISEHGIYFSSRTDLQPGALLEMYFVLPRQLTGRSPERVTCKARVTYVDQELDSAGARGVGVAVGQFEPQTTIDDEDVHQDTSGLSPRTACRGGV